MERKIKVMVVDDHQIFRKGLVMLLKQIGHIDVIDEASNGLEFLEKIEKIDPEIVLMDIKMPILNGIEATKRALLFKPQIKIVVLSMFGEEEYFQNMLDAGVKGFLLKNIGIDELDRALRIISEGGSYYSNELISILTKNFVTKGNEEEDEDMKSSKLTKREVQVLELICQGFTNIEIAKELYISQRTVDGHRTNLLTKTGSKNSINMVTQTLKYDWLKSGVIRRV
ncbi:MAG: response regulator transcription factor [Bacteroidetes bacterium]|nr:response regulator transcription factor [Bacteroidota bacterium]